MGFAVRQSGSKKNQGTLESKGFKLTMEKFLAWKILPRLMMLSMTIMSYQVVQWFMALGADATTQQAAFVSTVVGAMTGAFAVWMGHENK